MVFGEERKVSFYFLKGLWEWVKFGLEFSFIIDWWLWEIRIRKYGYG